MILSALITHTHRYLSLIEGVPIHYFLLAVVAYYVSVFLFALRWRLVLRGAGHDVSLTELFKAFLASNFVNNITPTSRSGGEFLRILWVVRRAGVPPNVSAASVIYERLLEAVPFFLLMLMGSALLFSSALPVVVIGLGGVLVLWFRWDVVVSLFIRITKADIDEEGLKELASLRNSLKVTGGGILLSALVWVLDLVRFKLLTMAFGLDVPWGIIVMISVVNMLLGVLSITPGGVGIVEGGLAGSMAHLGIPQAIAVSITLLERFISYVTSTVVGFGVLSFSGGAEIWRALKSR